MNCSTSSIRNTTKATASPEQSPQPTLTQQFSDFVHHNNTSVIAACTAIALLALGYVAITLNSAEDPNAQPARINAQVQELCNHVARQKKLNLENTVITSSGLTAANEVGCFITTDPCTRQDYETFCNTHACKTNFPFDTYKTGQWYNGGMSPKDLTFFSYLSEDDLRFISAIQLKFRCASNKST